MSLVPTRLDRGALPNFVAPVSGCYVPDEEQNVVVRRTYLPGGRLYQLIASNPATWDQTTT